MRGTTKAAPARRAAQALGALAVLVCLASCQGLTHPPRDFIRALRTAPRGYIERHGEQVAECGVAIERRALPRGAAVTIDAVQPDGTAELHRVWRDGNVLYRARTRYDAGIPARAVLVDPHGRVVERSYQLAEAAAGPALAPAIATLRRELGESDADLHVVHGSGGGEWLRARSDSPFGARVADCDLDGALRRVHTVEWVDGGVDSAKRLWQQAR